MPSAGAPVLRSRLGRQALKVAAAAIAATAALVTGCATAGKSRAAEGELVQLLQLLPGSYDNRAQVAADRRAGREPRTPLVLDVVSVDSLLLGDHVFYERQTSDDELRSIVAQQLISFTVVNHEIVQTVWALTEPRRWRSGVTHPELFTSLQQPDVKHLVGCALIWKSQDGKFTATGDRQKCHTPAPQADGSVFVAARAQLSADELALSERSSDDAAAQGHDDDFIRFRRRESR
jgi:hypothetical protein